MSDHVAVPLSHLDRCLLRAAGTIVPAPDRDDWRRGWAAELWHKRNRDRTSTANSFSSIADLPTGLVLDALWLRVESCRRTLRGTATLCLASLAGLSLLSALLGLALRGSLSALVASLAGLAPSFLFAALLVLFVTLAVAPSRPVEQRATRSRMCQLKRHLFFLAKVTLLLLFTFVMSSNCCQPLSNSSPAVAEFLNMLLFVLFALLGLRWALQDQEQRCKDCLHTLASPTQVGRPSHNLLEWNGTEMACVRGHGRLSVPELETSWCRSSVWESHSFVMIETKASVPQ